jgi:hypothetical protein
MDGTGGLSPASLRGGGVDAGELCAERRSLGTEFGDVIVALRDLLVGVGLARLAGGGGEGHGSGRKKGKSEGLLNTHIG